MTKRERIEAVYALKPADRIPFVPAIYEHKGALIGKSPSEIGGNTTPIIDDLIATGATQFLSDHPANLARWCEKALAARVPVRANVDALLVNRGPASAVRRQAVEILRDFHNHPGFLLGCGVVAYDGVPEYVHEIRHAIDDLAAGRLDFERECSPAS